MVKIIPRKKVIKRRPAPPVNRVGSGWPLRQGYPHDSEKEQYHLLGINGKRYVALWEPIEPMWDFGIMKSSPLAVAEHDYLGVCTPVYRSPTTPDPAAAIPKRRFR